MTFSEGNNVYYYETNLQGDVIGIKDSSGQQFVTYAYDAWGNLLYRTNTQLADYNPLRYRGYVYDWETGLYYLQSRYYNPEWGRFINADVYAATGQGFTGNNMFAYCGNNPVNRADPSGNLWGLLVLVGVGGGVCLLLTGCSNNSGSPRSDLANAPDLDINTASPDSYNCYGNAIGKQIDAKPTGYKEGYSTEKTFELVKNDLGNDNVRRLDSINDPIEKDEFKVAIKCGVDDFHFIRLTDQGWYNKSGDYFSGLYVPESYVDGKVWYAKWKMNGWTYIGLPEQGFSVYDDTTIYFAVKIGWDEQ